MTIISSSSASRTVMALAMLLAGSVMPVSATVRAPDGAFHVGGLHGNGVIQVEVNGKAINGVSSPMITEMKIGGGLVVVPRENVGAGFQFASRGDGGNKYNPTLGGDCVGRAPDIGLNYIQDWRPLDFLPAENGLLLGVQPYLYQGDQIAMAGVDPGCSGSVEKHAELAPCFFHWGVLNAGGSWSDIWLALARSGTNANRITDAQGNTSLIDQALGETGWHAGSGDDHLLGGVGNDVLVGGAGNDVIDGGAGIDMAVFFGTIADYQVALHRNAVTGAHDALIRHKVIGDVDTVRDVELFKIGGSVYLVPAGQPQPADDVYVEMAEYVQASVNDLVLVGLPPSTLLG